MRAARCRRRTGVCSDNSHVLGVVSQQRAILFGITTFFIAVAYAPLIHAQEFDSRSIATYTAEQAAQGKALSEMKRAAPAATGRRSAAANSRARSTG